VDLESLLWSSGEGQEIAQAWGGGYEY
jgi:hypothetical protein